jgi:hypothetical protein
MLSSRRRLLIAASLLWPSAVIAADLAVPIFEEGGDGQAANCMSSVVGDLPRGREGFLAVRSGPGSDFAKLAQLKNGETVVVFQTKGEWAGVVYRTTNVTCSSKTTRPVTYEKKGWVHSKWLKPLAG